MIQTTPRKSARELLESLRDSRHGRPYAPNEHPLDRYLRDHLFLLHERKGENEPLWIRDGRVYRQAAAVAQAEGEGD